MGTETKSILLEAYLEKRPALKRFLAARFRDEQIAEDILQDMYLRLDRLGDDTAIDNPGAFLFRIANNLTLDHRRQQRRQMARDRNWSDLNRTDAGDEPMDESPRADRAVEAQQRVRLLRQALNELPPQCRKAFELHKLQGHSHKQTAEILGIAVSTVEKHMGKAMKFLILHLKDMD